MQNIIGVGLALLFIIWSLTDSDKAETGASLAEAETYRLIIAKGNSESEVARGLSKFDCEDRKKELKATAQGLSLHNERLGISSITCLPESVF